MSRPRAPRIGVAPTRVVDAKSRPLVAVRPDYVAALRAAGALTFLLANFEPLEAGSYLEDLDGLLLPGGGDVHPRLYGETAEDGLELIDDDVAIMQIALARAALEARVPTLGICLGCQVMNVACGGTLIQDLVRDSRPGAVAHTAAKGSNTRHQVAIAPGSRLFAATQEGSLEVTSQHHQAVRDLGKDLMVSAVSPDNVIEAVEHREAPFFVGIQWHPERNPESVDSRRLFTAFATAATQRQVARGAFKD